MSQRYLGGFNKPGYDPLAANVTTGAITVQDQGVFTMQAVEAAQGSNSWNSDPYFNDTVLLVQADNSANLSTNNTFLDSSTNNFALTRTGLGTQGSFSPYLSGQWSYASDNVGDYARVPSSAALAMGTGDFTIEVWAYYYAIPAQSFLYDQRIAAGSLSPFINISSSNIVYGFGATNAITVTQVISAGVWFHIAVSRVSGITRLFMNGNQIGTNYADTNNYVANLLTLGARYDLLYYMQGFMSNLRVLKGTGLYTTTFAPPTAPLTAITNTALLTFKNQLFTDESVNNAALSIFGDAKLVSFSPYPTASAYNPETAGGSGYFPTTAYLSNATAGVTNFGTGDFTVSYWVYPTVTPSAGFAVHVGTATTGAGLAFGTATTFFSATTSATGYTSTVTATANVWHYVTWTRTGTTLRFYKNAVLGFTTTLATNLTELGVGIAAQKNAANPFEGGFLSDINVIKGTAIVPTGVPIAPSVANAGTSLLCKFTNAGIYDATGNNNLTSSTSTVSTNIRKYGSGSINNGNTTALKTQLVAFGTGNFTIEFWARVTNVFSAACFFDTRITATSVSGIAIQLTATAAITVTINNAVLLTTSMFFARRQSLVWSHVAVVKANGVVYVYIDGQRGVTSSAASVISLTDNFLSIGAAVGGTAVVAGNMDDVRVTNGIARYTAPYFKPPSRGFAKQ